MEFYEDEDPKKYYRGEVVIEDSDKFYSGEVNISDLERLGQNEGPNEREINGTTYRKYRFKFPFDVRLGYHNVEFSYIDKNGVEVVQKTRLISAPQKCYDGLGITEGKKTWGVPTQLYEQVSENNLGIGNFSDLAHLGYILGKNGAGVMGVNPLHATRDDQPENASPYGPDSRMFFNYIYVDVTAVDEFKNSKRIRDYYNSPEFQEKLKINRRRTYVDYTTTQALVDDILHRCFEEFKYSPESEEARNRFNVYCDDKGQDLEMFATFRALSKYFAGQNPAPALWKDWPEAYKNPHSPEVEAFKRQHRSEIDYFKYTQWLCENQLQQVKENCLNSGMKIGLYMDMAVGASCKGFEAWYYSDLYLKGTAGAKPDILSASGQKWGLLGFNPVKLQEQGYEPYRRILEANMRYAGCLRIDHVLQLHRLFMFPDNGAEGNYVYYNVKELMAIVALESHRNKTMVIGEDLGDMTDDLRRNMENFGILSYRVLPFERKSDMYRSMRHPGEYPQMSVCAPSTHDTPTLVSQWNVQHVWQQKLLGVLNDKQADDAFEQYASQREGMNWILGHYGIWDEVGGSYVADPRGDPNTVPAEYIPAVTTFLARSNSAIMLMPFPTFTVWGRWAMCPACRKWNGRSKSRYWKSAAINLIRTGARKCTFRSSMSKTWKCSSGLRASSTGTAPTATTAEDAITSLSAWATTMRRRSILKNTSGCTTLSSIATNTGWNRFWNTATAIPTSCALTIAGLKPRRVMTRQCGHGTNAIRRTMPCLTTARCRAACRLTDRRRRICCNRPGKNRRECLKTADKRRKPH